jgi:MFS family permease
VRAGKFLGALSDRDFRLYFVGQMTSAVGTGMTMVALSFAVLATHAGASALGSVLAAETVPLAVFLLAGGVVADRLGRRRVMLGADALRGAAQAGLGAWVLLGPPPLWGFLVLAALVGTGTAFFTPAIAGMIPSVVREEHLSQANALNGLTFSIGTMVGPAIAGVIVAAASPGWAVIADAASYAVSVATLAMLRSSGGEMPARTGFFHQLRVGWREFWSRTWLWVIVVQWSVGNMLVFAPFFVLGAVIAKRSLGGATAWGTILAFQGVGAIAGGLVMLRVRPGRPLLVAVLSGVLVTWPLLALGLGAPLALIAAGAGASGIQLAVFAVLWDTTIQREVPPESRSRVSAYDWFGSLVFLPAGYAIAGPISGAIGIRTTFVAAGAYCVASTLLVLCVPAVTRLRWAPAPAVEAEAIA